MRMTSIQGLEQLAAPEESAVFGMSDVIAALVTMVTFNSDLISDVLLALHLWEGDRVDRQWALAIILMARKFCREFFFTNCA